MSLGSKMFKKVAVTEGKGAGKSVGKKVTQKEGKGLLSNFTKKKASRTTTKKASETATKKGSGKVGKIATVGGIGSLAYLASNTGTGEGKCDPFGGNYVDCMGKKIGDTIKTILIFGLIMMIVIVLISIFLPSLFNAATNTVIDGGQKIYNSGINAYNSGRKRLSEFRSPPQNVAIPSSGDYVVIENPAAVSMSGGGKNNLDKYMYCLILLLGIGIHHLYVNYEKKINQYLELIDKKDELIY